jgi:hypothetical protein
MPARSAHASAVSSGQYAIKSHFHCRFYAYALLFGFAFGQLGCIVRDIAGAGQLARRDDGLFHDKTLFAAVNLSATNFVA